MPMPDGGGDPNLRLGRHASSRSKGSRPDTISYIDKMNRIANIDTSVALSDAKQAKENRSTMTASTHSASRSSRAFGVALTAGIVALALTGLHPPRARRPAVHAQRHRLHRPGRPVRDRLRCPASVDCPLQLVPARCPWRLCGTHHRGLGSRAYFPLAYFAKGVEIALIGLITIDVFRVYGSPMGLIRTAMTSVFGDRTGGNGQRLIGPAPKTKRPDCNRGRGVSLC